MILNKASYRSPLTTRLENTEVYNIVCDSLFIEPKPNNGTLRLPLKPIGLHSDTPPDTENLVDDPPDQEPNTTNSPTPSSPSSSSNSTIHPNPNLTSSISASPQNSTTADSDRAKNAADNFWGFIAAKLKAIKTWVENTLASKDHSGGDDGDDGDDSSDGS